MFKSLFLPILGVMAFIILVGLTYQGKIPLGKVNNQTDDKKYILVNDKKIFVEIAKTNEERAKGLSDRDVLDENSGMIFVFNNEKPVFWMKDTKIAIDIIWINDNKVVGIEKNVQPEQGKKDIELKRYPAPTAIDYVLEVNAGFSDRNNIKVGTSVQKLSDL